MIEAATLPQRILPDWPSYAPDEVAAAAAVLRSGKVNYWTGEEGRRFEEEFARYVGVRHAVALANGSVALELALHVLGVGAGDEVITPSRTFLASATCAVMRGARPVFAEVDRESGNLTAESIRAQITPRTRAIIAVHLAGWPCAMDPILELAREHGLKVIEDCAQSHGASYKGRMTGALGDVAAFSFCQDKIMTTAGEGGMLVTNDEGMAEAAWAYKDHGKSYDAVYRREHPPGYRWLHESFGTNWRLTEVQSAIGRLQLRKLPQWLELRRRNAEILRLALAECPAVRIPVPPAECRHAYYKLYGYVRPERLQPEWSRDRIAEAITAEGVPCFSGSCSEIYLEKAFPAEWRPGQSFAVARELGETSLMFLVHPTLSEEDMLYMGETVARVLRQASR